MIFLHTRREEIANILIDEYKLSVYPLNDSFKTYATNDIVLFKGDIIPKINESIFLRYPNITHVVNIDFGLSFDVLPGSLFSINKIYSIDFKKSVYPDLPMPGKFNSTGLICGHFKKPPRYVNQSPVFDAYGYDFFTCITHHLPTEKCNIYRITCMDEALTVQTEVITRHIREIMSFTYELIRNLSELNPKVPDELFSIHENLYKQFKFTVTQKNMIMNYLMYSYYTKNQIPDLTFVQDLTCTNTIERKKTFAKIKQSLTK